MARPPLHPGKILTTELKEVGVKPIELAHQIKMRPEQLTQIIEGKRAVTADTALRLAHWFGTAPAFWLRLQNAYDIRTAERKSGRAIRRLPTREGNHPRP